jgi:hypothetical protein
MFGHARVAMRVPSMALAHLYGGMCLSDREADGRLHESWATFLVSRDRVST